MTDSKDSFLKAEMGVRELLKALERLKREADSYESAARNLDGARDALMRLVQGTEAIVKDIHRAVQVLASVGGPEILTRLDALAETGKEAGEWRRRARPLLIGAVAASVVAAVAALAGLFL